MFSKYCFIQILQDLELLRKVAGCQELVTRENFERLWCWLYPVAFTLSQEWIKAIWDSVLPKWIEGLITKEEAEASLQGNGRFQDPGTFLLRFPTSRSWPHPDAGNIVVTYVGCDYSIHHKLLSLDMIYRCVPVSFSFIRFLLMTFNYICNLAWSIPIFVDHILFRPIFVHCQFHIIVTSFPSCLASSGAKETNVKPLKEMLLDEPELSRLGRQDFLTIYLLNIQKKLLCLYVNFAWFKICRIRRAF